jgi:monoamine oxidase
MSPGQAERWLRKKGGAVNRKIDYAVVGGGIGGAYSAWRIKQAMPNKRVVLLEHSNRIGGRLFTRPLPGIESVNAELGGMRYIPSIHPLVTGLVKELGLAHRDFPMGDPKADPQGNNNYAYYRRQLGRIGQQGNSASMPYRVDESELNQTPDALQERVLTTLVPNYQKLSFDDWFEVEVFGKPLYEYGFWNLLYRVLSPEAFEFLRIGSGYDTNVSNGSSVSLLPTGGEYSPSNPYLTLVDGMEAIPKTLAKQFEDRFGGEVMLNARLARIVRREDGAYSLRVHGTASENGVTRDRRPAEVTDLIANHVILAMPRRSLELVEWNQFQEDAFLRANLGSVLIQGAFKLFLAYPYPWWKALGLAAGRSMTDMPIRQTFYFTSPDELDKPNLAKKPALLMASYNDISTVPFWKGLEGGETIDGPSDARATKRMVDEAHRQVLELHGQRELPRPYAAAYRDWSEDPFGGAWHCWKAGFRYNAIIPRMTHPVRGEKVYVCGEAYSNNQGWAEGALETAEQMLTDQLKIPKHRVSRGVKTNLLRRVEHTTAVRAGGRRASRGHRA